VNILPICTHPQDFRRTDLARDADAHPRSESDSRRHTRKSTREFYEDMCHTSSLERIARDAESDRTNARHSSPRAARRREELRCFDALTLQTGQTRKSDSPRSEDIIMVRVRARRAGGQAVSSADQAARSARGKAWPFCTWDCFKNTAFPLLRCCGPAGIAPRAAGGSRRWLDGSVKDAASAACSFSLAEAAARW
jgi:hypothetical protein